MPTQLAFDGETLEAALARVNEEVGPHARITHADKVRTGGIAGFFARERFEVMVEVDEDVPVPVPSGGGAAADASPPLDAAPSAPPPKSLLDLAEAVSAEERSTASAPAPEAAAADQPNAPRADWWTISSNENPIPSTAGRTFHDVLQGIAAEAGLITPPIPETPAAEPAPETGSLAASGQDAPAGVERPAPVSDEPVPVTADSLVTLGIPRSLLGPGSGRTSAAQRVLTAMEQLPPAEPLLARRGDVVVVVGDEQVAMQAAAVAAAQFGQTIDDVVVAGMDKRGFNTLSCPLEAEALAARWRRCGVPFVVAVCAPGGSDATRWARQMIDALDPVAVWAAVRADRKPDDVAAWTSRLGRADALAVGACDETVSPAAVLGAGIPVAVLEGRRSTAAAWTALLVERLAP